MNNKDGVVEHSPDRIARIRYGAGSQASLSQAAQSGIFNVGVRTALQDIFTGAGVKIELPGRHPLYSFESDTNLSMEIVEDIFDLFDTVDPLYRNKKNLPSGLEIGEVWQERLKETRPEQLQYIKAGEREPYCRMVQNMFIGRNKSQLLDSTARVAWKHTGMGRIFNTVSHKVIDRVKTFERVTGLSRAKLVTSDDWSLWGMKTENGIINGFEPEHGLHAWHIQNLVETNSVPSNPGILELGGGIGSIAEKLYQWSDQPFTIFLVDLPLNVTTAYAYLARILGRENVTLVTTESDIESLTLSEEKQVVLLPTIYIESLLTTHSYEIVHNSASLSEMEFDIIEWYLEQLLGQSPTFFIETNTNVRKNEFETLSRNFPVPEQYDLFGRFEANEKGGKYCTSLYKMQT